MSAAQRQTTTARRKTTRRLFDDDDEPPAKRSKVESAGTERPALSKTTVARSKRSRTAYDEDADGFTFARKTRSKKTSDESVSVEEPKAPGTKPRAAAMATTKRSESKTDSLLASSSSGAELPQPRRRSARLSSDKDEVVQILPAQLPRRKRKSNELKAVDDTREVSPELAQNELHVGKKRAEGTKIALPFADTPVINRNKEMRAAKSNKNTSRRSSVSSRGRRASSLIESGTSNGKTLRTCSKVTPRCKQKEANFSSFLSDSSLLSQTRALSRLSQDDGEEVILLQSDLVGPQTESQDEDSSKPVHGSFLEESFANSFGLTADPHLDVEVSDFYKHIDHSLIEPKRMRQLLAWCGTRALPPKPNGGNVDDQEAFTFEASKSIIEDLLKAFANDHNMSDWFSREDNEASSVAVVRRPNPRNAQNRERLRALEEEIGRLKDEEKVWSELTKMPKSKDEAEMSEIDVDALDPAQAAIFAELHYPRADHEASTAKATARQKSKATPGISNTELGAIATRLQTINAELEPQIDLFADGIHKIGQYRIAAERVADAILRTTAKKLDVRETEAEEASGTAAVGARNILSALASALNTRGEVR